MQVSGSMNGFSGLSLEDSFEQASSGGGPAPSAVGVGRNAIEYDDGQGNDNEQDWAPRDDNFRVSKDDDSHVLEEPRSAGLHRIPLRMGACCMGDMPVLREVPGLGLES